MSKLHAVKFALAWRTVMRSSNGQNLGKQEICLLTFVWRNTMSSLSSKLCALTVAGLCLLLATGPMQLVATAEAAPITFYFTGDLISTDTNNQAAFPALPVGTTISGYYTFESTTADTQPDPGQGYYTGAVSTASVQLGTSMLNTTAAGLIITRVGVTNAPDGYFMGTGTSGGLLDQSPINFSSVQLNLYEAVGSHDALSSDALPTVPPIVSLFDFINTLTVYMNLGNTGFISYNAEVTSLSLSPVSDVPLPAALPLFAAGLSAMGFMGWRRRRKIVIA